MRNCRQPPAPCLRAPSPSRSGACPPLQRPVARKPTLDRTRSAGLSPEAAVPGPMPIPGTASFVEQAHFASVPARQGTRARRSGNRRNAPVKAARTKGVPPPLCSSAPRCCFGPGSWYRPESGATAVTAALDGMGHAAFPTAIRSRVPGLSGRRRRIFSRITPNLPAVRRHGYPHPRTCPWHESRAQTAKRGRSRLPRTPSTKGIVAGLPLNPLTSYAA